MSNLEGRSLLDELKKFDGQSFFDLGHPLLNRIAESFVKAAGIGALQAVSREAYYTAVEGLETNNSQDFPKQKRQPRFPNLKGETCSMSLESMVKRTGKESMQWGLAAGMYTGVTYGLSEVRGGVHDWKNAVVAGAMTGATLALTQDDPSHDQIVQGAITGAALTTAANLLNKVL
eukprot:Gb_38687 [translate_table: standard]